MPIALGARVPGLYGPGIVALGIVYSAYMAETIRAGIEAVPRGQVEAARSLGMSRAAATVSVVMPQAFRIIIPPLTNELVALIKDTSLLALLGTTAQTIEITKYSRDAVSRTVQHHPARGRGAGVPRHHDPARRGPSALLERRNRRAR